MYIDEEDLETRREELENLVIKNATAIAIGIAVVFVGCIVILTVLLN